MRRVALISLVALVSAPSPALTARSDAPPARLVAKCVSKEGYSDPAPPAHIYGNTFITPHPGASDLFERLAGKKPLIDARACADYAKRGRNALEARLRKEGQQ